MDNKQFWQIIELAEQDAGKLLQTLTVLDPEAILAFNRHFRVYMAKAYTSSLWAAAYIVNGGCSDDCFDYFRAWLIAQGNEVYENAVANPDSLILIADQIENEEGGCELEAFIYVPERAYEVKTQRDDFFEVYTNRYDQLDLPDIGDMVWAEDENLLYELLPQLARRFW